jgi:hypothetical protein
MHIVSPTAQVVHGEGDVTPVGGLADQRDAQRAEVLGEDRDDVDPQRATSP